jgi:hypothetical protein
MQKTFALLWIFLGVSSPAQSLLSIYSDQGGCYYDEHQLYCRDQSGYQKGLPRLVNPVSLGTSPELSCALDEGKIKCWGDAIVRSLPNRSAVTLVGQWENKYCLYFAEEQRIRCADLHGQVSHQLAGIKNPRRFFLQRTWNFSGDYIEDPYAFWVLDDDGIKGFDAQGGALKPPPVTAVDDFSVSPVTNVWGGDVFCFLRGGSTTCLKRDSSGQFVTDSMIRVFPVAKPTVRFEAQYNIALAFSADSTLFAWSIDPVIAMNGPVTLDLGIGRVIDTQNPKAGYFGLGDSGKIAHISMNLDVTGPTGSHVVAFPAPYSQWHHPRFLPSSLDLCVQWDEGAQCFLGTNELMTPDTLVKPTDLAAEIAFQWQFHPIYPGTRSASCTLSRGGALDCTGNAFTPHFETLQHPTQLGISYGEFTRFAALDGDNLVTLLLGYGGLTTQTYPGARLIDVTDYGTYVYDGTKLFANDESEATYTAPALNAPFRLHSLLTAFEFLDAQGMKTFGTDGKLTAQPLKHPKDVAGACVSDDDGVHCPGKLYPVSQYDAALSYARWVDKVFLVKQGRVQPLGAPDSGYFFFPPYAAGLSAWSDLDSRLSLLAREAPVADQPFLAGAAALMGTQAGTGLGSLALLSYLHEMGSRPGEWRDRLAGTEAAVQQILSGAGITSVKDIALQAGVARAAIQACLSLASTDEQRYLSTDDKAQWNTVRQALVSTLSGSPSIAGMRASLQAALPQIDALAEKLAGHFYFSPRAEAFKTWIHYLWDGAQPN